MGFRLRSIRQRSSSRSVPVVSSHRVISSRRASTAGDAINLARTKLSRTPPGSLPVASSPRSILSDPLAMVYLSAHRGESAVLEMQEAKTNGAAAALRTPDLRRHHRKMRPCRETGHRHGLKDARHARCARRSPPNGHPGRGLQRLQQQSPRTVPRSGAVIRQETSARSHPVLAFVRDRERRLLCANALLVSDLAARSSGQRPSPVCPAGREAQPDNVQRRPCPTRPATAPFTYATANPQASAALVALENTVLSRQAPRHFPPPVDPRAWNQAVGGVSAGLSAAGRQRPPSSPHGARRPPTHRLSFDTGRRAWLPRVLLSVIVSVWIGRGRSGTGRLRPVVAGTRQHPAASVMQTARWMAGSRRVREHLRSQPAPTRLARSGQAFTTVQQTPSRPPWARPSCAGGIERHLPQRWPGAASPCCTGS